LALVSLLMLRSLVRSVPAQAATSTSSGISLPVEMAAATAAASTEPTAAAEEAPVHKSRLKRRGVTGPSLRDELAELVKEDPDTAVSVLRNWIGSAT
jgi:flagellar biosynthesis/type III secretory pathway M-ring protein FliF/YscJ